MKAAFKILGAVVLGIFLLLLTLWSAAALRFDVPLPWLRWPLACVFVLTILLVWIFAKWRRAVVVNLVAFAVVLGWWLSLKPSNTRDWLPDLALLPYAESRGNLVTIHNIRNCDYRTTTDFDVRHYDKTFDLAKLRFVDLFLVYWGSPHMAHTMISFGFDGGDYVCFSIETRKEVGEGYSALKGLYRQFELTYVVADERDVVRLRTNYRKNDQVYLFRSRMTPEQGRSLFLGYLRRANELRERAEWYNAVSDNCTTAIRAQRAATDRAPWDWRMLVNGHLDELLYERGVIATNLPLATLKEQGHINARAKEADQAADFSRRIREGLP
jgi:hypothetical protein